MYGGGVVAGRRSMTATAVDDADDRDCWKGSPLSTVERDQIDGPVDTALLCCCCCIRAATVLLGVRAEETWVFGVLTRLPFIPPA